jgi:proline iminopeptidase
MCAGRSGLPPLLIVQAGPGLPLLHEVIKFQQRLHVESDFLVSYWEQRGCGAASQRDAKSVSLPQQAGDLRAVLRWLQNETRQKVTVLGISLGATIALQAVGQESDKARSIIAVSPDANTASSDAAVRLFLQEQSARPENHKLRGKVKKLGPPPYTDSVAFQRRARLLTDLGGIERGKKFNALLIETLWGMIRTYGFVGTAKALRNLNLIQSKLLAELVPLDLFANPPRLAVPVHFLFGGQDPLTPASIIEQLPAATSAPAKTVLLVPDAGHMVHFDRPEVTRSVMLNALKE